MKQIEKAALSVLLLLLLLLALSACTPSMPSDLTAPPSESIPQPTEHIRTELDGLGTICYVLKSDMGYALLTHTGWYTVDANFQNRERLGSPYNDVFDNCEKDSFFERLTSVENYDASYFRDPCLEEGHFYFYCSATDTFVIDGKEVDPQDYGVRKEYIEKSGCRWYDGAFYTYLACNGKTYLFRNDEMMKITDKYYTGFVLENEELYLVGHASASDLTGPYWTKINKDFTLGEPVLRDEASWDLLSSPKFIDASVAGETQGKYSYNITRESVFSEPDEYGYADFLGYRYTFSRTDGEKVETLECKGMDEILNASENYSWFIGEDRQIVLITQTNRRANITTLDFTVKEG